MATEYTPRAYFASLNAYNNGKLHGVWVDLEGKDEEEIQAEVTAMLINCPEHNRPNPSEEWAIHDSELGGIKVSESTGFAALVEIAEGLADHGEKFAVAYQNFGDVSEALTACSESYQGHFRNLEEYAEDFAEQTGLLSQVPESIRNYFDFAAMGRDMALSDIWTAEGTEGGIHVFTNN